ncbi:hypothetical protein B0T10DRAFT_556307 [Thelonectria olida]|uniref:Uncharacterized protein n=1 Tax=Thelonectria olida TaxID=1576542 RepID=A0A9P8WJA5_9HYPO|nr:hypothetical protein B0T10DRAFT_556307 [Thelonectria olida]
MALALSQAASLKAEIRLSVAISEFSQAIDQERRVELRVLKSQHAPTFRGVIELANRIAKDGKRQHGGRWLPRYGPRLEPLLHRIQLFTKAGDILIGGSQNMIASGVWACVRLFLQVAIGYLSFFDRLSLL